MENDIIGFFYVAKLSLQLELKRYKVELCFRDVKDYPHIGSTCLICRLYVFMSAMCKYGILQETLRSVVVPQCFESWNRDVAVSWISYSIELNTVI